jgi:hypothetical protein
MNSHSRGGREERQGEGRRQGGRWIEITGVRDGDESFDSPLVEWWWCRGGHWWSGGLVVVDAAGIWRERAETREPESNATRRDGNGD